MSPQILAVRSALPGNRCVQAEFTDAFATRGRMGRAERSLLERLHAAAEVKTRHTVLPLEECGVLLGAEAVNDRYIDEATLLGERALRAALDAAGVAAADLDLLIVTSVTGVAVPSLDARLIPVLGMRRDIKRLPIFGLGCVAGAAALGRVHDYLLAWPGQTAALLAIELCSLNWPTSGITTADMVAAGLFGDGAVALVARGGQDDARIGPQVTGSQVTGPQVGGPQVIASRSAVYPDSGDALGWRLSSDCFRIVLTTELPDVVERGLANSVTEFLAEYDLTIDDIASWICHPGGPKVLDAVQRALKLPDSAVAASRRSLAEVGNLSSASVLHILEMISETERPPPGSAGLMIGLGPGVSAELVLLRWLSSGSCSGSSRASG
ncbi:MAG TPA: 3-oxoacyl-[acyl-carrier-protein] synthase III C-terminal domain-containing protein [Trebonia sp.]|nr:3-oxoacyl-[acyl-carrier-protein] synthase III C-terminal domain-containing protein [Trebonia sp.]